MSQADLTHQRLVRAALELFTTQGYHGTTTPLIAKKAGVAEGSIYRHFDGKQHLLNELYRGAARWAGKLVKEADGLRVGPREKLVELFRGKNSSSSPARSSRGRRASPRWRGSSCCSATMPCSTTRAARPRATSGWPWRA